MTRRVLFSVVSLLMLLMTLESAAAIGTTGLVAHYALNSTADSLGAYNGTLLGSLGATNATCKSGSSCYKFVQTTNDRFETGIGIPNGSSWAIDGWVNSTTMADATTYGVISDSKTTVPLFGMRYWFYRQAAFEHTTGLLISAAWDPQIDCYTGSGDGCGSVNMNDGVPRHFVINYDNVSNKLYYYLNGTLLRNESGTGAGNLQHNRTIVIGGYAGGSETGNSYAGTLQHFNIWLRQNLTQQNVTDLYNSGAGNFTFFLAASPPSTSPTLTLTDITSPVYKNTIAYFNATVTDSEQTTLSVTMEFFVNNVFVANQTNASVANGTVMQYSLSGYWNTSNTIFARVNVTDGTATTSSTTANLTIANIAPTLTLTNIASPVYNNTAARFNATIADEGASTLNVTMELFVNNVFVANQTNASVANGTVMQYSLSGYWNTSNTIFARVNVTDGTATTSSTTANLTIANNATAEYTETHGKTFPNNSSLSETRGMLFKANANCTTPTIVGMGVVSGVTATTAHLRLASSPTSDVSNASITSGHATFSYLLTAGTEYLIGVDSLGADYMNYNSASATLSAIVNSGYLNWTRCYYAGAIQNIACVPVEIQNLTISCTGSGTPASITLTSPAQYAFFQRNSSNQTSITITGTSVNVPSIEAKFGTQNWTTINSSVSNGTYTGTLTVSIGQGKLYVRSVTNTSANASVTNISVGDLFVIAGQSNAVGYGLTDNTLNASNPYMAMVYREDDVWRSAYDHTSSQVAAEGSIWPLVANYLTQAHNIPIGFITTAQGGRKISEFQYGQERYSVIINQTNEATNGRNAVKAVLFFQGESDAYNIYSTGYTAYKSGLESLANSLKTNLTVDYFIAGQIAEINNGQASTTNIDAVRKAQLDAWNEANNVTAGPTTHDVELTNDHLHFRTDAEIANHARRWEHVLNGVVYGVGTGRGVRVTSIVRQSNSTVNITFNTNDNLMIADENNVSGTKAAGFRILNGTTTLTDANIISTTLSGRNLIIVLNANITETYNLTFASGLDTVGQTVIRFNDSFMVPMETIYAQQITNQTPASGTPDALLNVTARDTLTNVSIINFTVTISNATYAYSVNVTTTNGTAILPTFQGIPMLVEINAPAYNYENTTINATNSTPYYQFDLFGENSITVYFYDEYTDATITQNVSVEFSGPNSTFTSSALGGSLYEDFLDPGAWTLTVSSSGYDDRTYFVTILSDSHIILDVRLINSTLSADTVFHIIDQDGNYIVNATMTIQGDVNGSYVTIAQKVTDFFGVAYFSLLYAETYRVIIEADGYITKQADFERVETDYTIRLTDSNTQGYRFYGDDFSYSLVPSNVSPSLTSFAISTSSPDGRLEWFSVTTLLNGSYFTTNVTGSPGGGTANHTLNLSPYNGAYVRAWYRVKSVNFTDPFVIDRTFFIYQQNVGNYSMLAFADHYANEWSSDEDFGVNWKALISVIVAVLLAAGMAMLLGVDVGAIVGASVLIIAGVAGWLNWSLVIISAGGVILYLALKGGR